ncbi:pyridoxamine 5'-phosphate oxidase family protein [Pseudohalocynthiibacter aestuariivivens]|nr:pyridoxamine 5'-phosphate oxidase family protein [Pseudohalocynthiibacter aestuariivivens]QIE44106.1 pyridoxamine 5'-phosphate oxidase family protein [Pseudohalocynthiibacter aestuariivivens]
MTDATTTEFWERAEKISAGMLSATGAPPRPMAHQVRQDDNALWFITAKATDIADAAQNGAQAQHILACSHGQLYAVIDGTLHVETDPQKLDDIWSPLASVWFEDGREDDDICLVRFTPQQAEVWTTDGAAKALYEFAKAAIKDEMPDTGDHARLHFG